jgi:hypothetical protein
MRRLVLVLLLTSTLYGASFQAFRTFDLLGPLAGPDVQSYRTMSHGDYDVFPVRRYRPIVPSLAAVVRVPLVPFVADPVRLDLLSFYVVNFAFALAAALLLYATHVALAFDWRLALLGSMLFVTSRVTVASVAAPLVDSLFFFSVAAIAWLTVTGRSTVLAFSMPLLALSKETLLPFLFLPLFNRETRSWKIAVSVVASITAMFALRAFIDSQVATPQTYSLGDMVGLLARANVPQSLTKLASSTGIYDLFNGFGFVALLALLGWIEERRGKVRKLPHWLVLSVPVAFAYALVSFNLGRLFFAAYVPVIAYALLLVERVFQESRPHPHLDAPLRNRHATVPCPPGSAPPRS